MSDIQLWLMDQDWGGKQITVPLYATKCTGVLDGFRWVIWPAMRLGAALQKALEARMKDKGATNFSGKFVVRDADFPIGLQKAEGVTPSFYFSHEAFAGAPVEAEEVPDEFLREVFEASGVADYALFKTVWITIISGIPRWLIRTMKPIDFGYFKVYAVPYRVNWKVNLIAAFPMIRSAAGRSGRKRLFAMVPALRSALFSSRQVELHEGEQSVFGWNLEITPTAKFSKFTLAVEAARRKACTGEAYVKQWGAIVGRLQSHIEEILIYASKKMSLPAAAIRSVRSGDPQGFLPLIETNSLRAQDVDRTDLPVVVNPSGTHVTDGSGAAIEVESFVPMRTVSFVRRNK